MLLTETFDGPLTVWKVKRCGDDIRLVTQHVSDEKDVLTGHISTTWAFPQFLYVLSKTGTIFKCDLEKKTTKPILLDLKLERRLCNSPIKGNTFLKPHFEGLVIVLPKTVLLTKIDGVVAHATLLQEVDLAYPFLNLTDFCNSYRFIGWTPQAE